MFVIQFQIRPRFPSESLSFQDCVDSGKRQIGWIVIGIVNVRLSTVKIVGP